MDPVEHVCDVPGVTGSPVPGKWACPICGQKWVSRGTYDAGMGGSGETWSHDKPGLIVVTCDRRPDYLIDTLTRLDLNGSDRFAKVIATDGPLTGYAEEACRKIFRYNHKPLAEPWTMFTCPGPVGTRLHMWRAFHIAKEYGWDALLYCEDDIAPAPRALEVIAQMKVPDHLAFLNFCEISEESLEDGLVEFGAAAPERRRTPEQLMMGLGYGSLHFVGSQCLLIPRRTIEFLLTCDPGDVPKFPWFHSEHSGDSTMGHYLSKSRCKKYGAILPSIVQHVGESSHARPDYKTPRAKRFVGFDFDCRKLLTTNPEFFK